MRRRPDHLRVMTNNVQVIAMWSVSEVIALYKPGSESKQPENKN